MKRVASPALLYLAATQCLGSVGQLVMATLSALVGAELAPAPVLATLPVAAGIIGIATATMPTARFSRQFGRRPVFLSAAMWGASGSALASFAIHIDSFGLFCLGCFVMGNNMASVAQYRFAVTEFVPNAGVSRAVALLMVGTLLAAMSIPWFIQQTRFLFPVEFSGTYGVLPLCYLGAAILLLRVPLGVPDRQTVPSESATLRQILERPRVQLAIVAAATGYATMSLIMTATPISMHVMDHYSVEATANVVRGHLLGMFAPSLVSGWLVARLGIARMLWLGVLINALCIAFAVSGQELWQYQLALIALGIGWNLLFVSGTTLLATVCHDKELLRAQGFNDFAMFTTMGLASLSAGALLSTIGWAAMNGLALGLLVIIVALLIRNRGRIG